MEKTHAIFVSNKEGRSVMYQGTEQKCNEWLNECLGLWDAAVNAGYNFFVAPLDHRRPDGIWVSRCVKWSHPPLGCRLSDDLLIKFLGYTVCFIDQHRDAVKRYAEFLQLYQLCPSSMRKVTWRNYGTALLTLPPGTQKTTNVICTRPYKRRKSYFVENVLLPDGYLVTGKIVEDC